MVFVLMLAFQLSGGLILLLNGLKTSKLTVIKNCFPGSNMIERDDDDYCVIPKEKMQKSAFPIYLNIIAFSDLVCGYALAAFSPSARIPTLMTVILVGAITAIITGAEWHGCNWYVKRKYPCNEKIPYSTLEAFEVDTCFTEKEIDRMFQ